MLQRLLKDTVLYSSGQILPRIVAFLLLPLISKYLTPEDYGMLGQIAMVYLVATSIVNLGLNISINKVYFESSDRSVQGGLIWTSFITLLFFNACLLALSIFFAPYLSSFLFGREGGEALILTAFASVSVSGLIVPFTTYLKLEKKALIVVSLAVLEVLIASCLTVFFVIDKGFGANGPLLSQLLSQGILLCLFLGLIASRVPFKIVFGKEFKTALILGFPYMFSFFGSFLIQSGTRFALVEARGLEEGGIFFVAQNCAKVLELFIMGMMAAWFPLFAELAKDPVKANLTIRKVTSTFVVVIAIPIAAAFLFAKPVLSLIVPEPLASGWYVVGILALAQGIFGIYALLQPLFVFEKKGGMQMLLEVTAGLIGTLGAFLASASFGLLGAALAQLTAIVFLIMGSGVLLKRLPIDVRGRAPVLFGLLAIIPASFFHPESLTLQFLQSSSLLGLFVAINLRAVRGALTYSEL